MDWNQFFGRLMSYQRVGLLEHDGLDVFVEAVTAGLEVVYRHTRQKGFPAALLSLAFQQINLAQVPLERVHAVCVSRLIMRVCAVHVG